MSRVILQKTRLAKVSAERVEDLVRTSVSGTVLHSDGNNLLVDLEPSNIDKLKQQLEGWVVSVQAPRIQVPDTRFKIRHKAD